MPLYENIILLEWLESAEPLPSRADFVPSGGSLDELAAWQHFGGLTRSGAFTKFCSNPDYYQEDFMFMGGVAFAFYFPVVERYIFQARVEDDEEVEAMWILAHCINHRFDPSTVQHVRHLRERILVLTQHVRGNLSKFCTAPAEQSRLDEAWWELAEQLESCK